MIRALIKDRAGAGAAEFALVLPLLITFLFGIIDSARLAWDYNRIAKATQMGARMAVVTNVLDSGLVDESYLGYERGDGSVLTQGDRIPKDALGQLICTEDGCTCAVEGECPESGTFNDTAFDAIVSRMQAIYPEVTADKVRVTYSGSGLGYAGDPTGMDISPTVTVSVVGMVFEPIALLTLVDLPLPDFRTSLTMEDGAGSTSN
jgi:Flp pilus assembly pilin Flp